MLFRNEKEEIIQKTRDILRECIIMEDQKYTYLLLGIENQSHIHYAMPVKNMIYDALNYEHQVSEIAKHHRDIKDLRGDEFLSGFSKMDKLKPVITLVIYFGTDKWDGPRCLKDMFDETNKDVLQYISDYKLNLLIPNEIEDFSKFSTDFGKAMKYISVGTDKSAYKEVSTEKLYDEINEETAKLLNKCIGLKILKKAGGIEMKMCKALEDIKLEGYEEGKLEILVQLVTEGILTLKDAASKVSITENEFRELMKNSKH